MAWAGPEWLTSTSSFLVLDTQAGWLEVTPGPRSTRIGQGVEPPVLQHLGLLQQGLIQRPEVAAKNRAFSYALSPRSTPVYVALA